jgi:hypothetical protein
MMQSSASLAAQARVISPEVTINGFRYFNGTQWLTSWAASFMQALPKAVEITISVRAGDPNNPNGSTPSSDPSGTVALRQYRHVVPITSMAQQMSIAELATIPTGTAP